MKEVQTWVSVRDYLNKLINLSVNVHDINVCVFLFFFSLGIVTCHTQIENKSQNQDQQAGEIKRQPENANEVENNENPTQETGALHKDGITELQKIAKDTQDAPHATNKQPALNDTQEPPIQVKEPEKINEKECNKSSEKNEHQKGEDTQQKTKDSDGNQLLENNTNSGCEEKNIGNRNK